VLRVALQVFDEMHEPNVSYRELSLGVWLGTAFLSEANIRS
jgi:hypothetical protein